MSYTPAQINESRAHARKLSASLAAGQRPQAIQVPFRLADGETCYAQGSAQLWQFLEGDGTYVHKSRGGFGLVGLALVAGTAVGNSKRRARAGREAAPRYRPVDEGVVYLTDRRFLVQGQMQWTDIWYGNIRVASCNGFSITFELSGASPMQLHVWPIDYYYVLFHYLAYNDVLQVPPDVG